MKQIYVMSQTEISQKLAGMLSLMPTTCKVECPKVEDDCELQPVIREVKQAEELISGLGLLD